ncbi:TonB-dependent receptor [Dyadobacter sp. CY323]|uniref:SusC/RagA family TonB-linked outer membrane protein n=1 Tax=Dyadobacter sp. CY323 TaxID=2907302 RepID=UPI001F446E02|nr:TonB-dependent receptor [Dyadobacter sp. CY323]MCE6989699.1 TonB-dependent receptor [Dyadobacter sp. CY323]
MKYSAFFYILICSICSVSFAEKSYAQNLNKMVTIHLRNVTLSEALDKLSSTADVKFVFVGSAQDSKKVELKANRQKLGEVLSKLLYPYGLSYVTMKNSIVITTTDFKANPIPVKPVVPIKNVLRISGKVIDEKGEPLPGVNIVLKGTSQGSNTGVDGSYAMEVPDAQSVLIFSFVGYESQEISVGNSTVINVSLKADTKALNEIVVIGYSSKQLSQLSSSVSVVTGKQLNDVTSNNPISLLQGKAPGVIVSNSSGDPNAASSIVVRGSSSITAGSAPLMVVDGIIGGNANPNDIESVTILKDAAATGLYGSRAANGVIIITTKAGKTGKTRIDFNASAGFNNVTTGNFKVMNSQQLYDYEKSFYPTDRFNNEIPASVVSQNTNWQDLAFRTGTTQNYVLSLSGGSEKTKFYISGNYYNEQGTLHYNDAKRYNVRANITQKINDRLKLNFKVNARFSNQGSDRAGLDGALYGAYNNMPWDNPYNADGFVNKGTDGGWYGREQENFLHGSQYNLNQANAYGLDGDLNLDYTILPNLTFSSYNRVSTSSSKSELYYDIRAKAGKGLGRLTNGFVSSLSMITSNRLHYDKNFGKHEISALAVLEGEKNKIESDGVTGEGFAPGLHVMNTASRILSATGSINESSFIKGLVQLDYNYDNRYFLVGSYINESSSRFGSNNRSGNFYTLGASWVLSNEGFMKDFVPFDLLKLRASYGVTGNAEIGNYQSFGLYSFATQYAGNSGAFPYQMDNPDLTWEKAKSLNFGLDISLYKRLMLNIDAYNKTTDGLLLNVELPYTSGFGSVIRNVGAIRNRGLELNLNSVNLDGEFRWETNFNIAFNRSKVLTLDQGKDIRSGNLLISEGEELYTWNMRKWMGVDPATGDPLWEQVSKGANGEEIRTTTNSYASATQQNVGSASPDFTGGMSNTWSYKGFTLSAFFNYVSGNKVYHNSRALFDSDGAYYTYNSMVLADGWNRWEKPGDIATHPKPVFGGNKNSNQASSRYLEDGSYIRLRNINFSYQLPDHLARKIKSENVRVFVSADNLVTFTKFSGMDPEVVLGPSGGTSSIKYPISKKVLFGINIGF